MAANTGCGIKCDTTSTAHAPNGYVKISGPSNPQEIACSASNQLDAITLVCGLKQPSFPSVTITATDPANQAISSGSYNDAAVITFSFAIKDGGNQAMSLPQLGSTFATTDITKTNCNAPPSPSPQFAGSGSAYMLYCSANNGQAVSVTTLAGAFTDGSANLALPSATFTVNSDTTAPTVTITASDENGITIADNAYSDATTVTFTFALSDSTSGFAIGDITKSSSCGGSLSGSTPGTSYTLTCSASNGNAITVGVGTSKYTDAAGNNNVASSPSTYTVNSDTASPTVTITASNSISSGDYSNVATITFSFALSEVPAAGTAFEVNDITAANCIAPASGTTQFVTTDSRNYKLLCLANNGNAIVVKVGAPNQFTGFDGAVADGFTDAAGKANSASNVFTVNSDTQAPTVTITATDQSAGSIADGSYNDATTVTFTFALSDSTSGFAIGDITKSSSCGGSLSGSTPGTSYTLTCSASNGNAITVGVGTSKYTDAAGNNNVASSPSTYTVNSDRSSPTVTITASDQDAGSISTGDRNDATAITFTFELSEAPGTPGTFDESDITKSQCNSPYSGSSFSVANVNQRFYTIICAANNGQTISVDVSSNRFYDAAGNGNTSPNAFTVVSDTAAPTVSISATGSGNGASGSISSGATTTATTITFAFSLSEAAASSTTFAESDITAVNCGSASFAGSSTSFTLECSGSTQSRTTSVTVAANKFKDSAGNFNAASATYTLTNDNTKPVPVLSAVNPKTGAAIASCETTAANKIRFIVTLPEAVSSASGNANVLDVGDLTIGSNCASSTRVFEKQSSTKFSLECDANNGQALTLQIAAYASSVGFKDVVGNQNAVSTVSGASGSTMTVNSDTEAPYVTITASDGTNSIASGGRTDLASSITFTFTLTASNVAVSQLTTSVTQGSGYTCQPTATINNNGGNSCGSATAYLVATHITAITLTAPGSGYTCVPDVSITSGGGSGGAVTATLVATTVDTWMIDDGGSSYTAVPTVSVTGGGGSGAAGTAVMTATKINSVTVNTAGSGYTCQPTVAIGGVTACSGSGATATSVLTATNINSYTVVSAGSGYTDVPTVAISGGGGGSNAAATATLVATTVASFAVTGGGASYTTPPVVSVSGGHSGGTDAAGTAVMAQTSIASYAIDGGQTNSGFTGVPTVTVGGSTSGGGSGAAATAVLTATTVASYTVDTAGAGYTDVPTVAVSGGGGSNAVAKATLSPTTIASFTVTNGGSSYTAVPTVTISGGGGSNAAGTAVMTPTSIASYAIDGGQTNSGFTGVPTVSVSGGGGSGAAATAVLTATTVASYTVDTAGAGYTDVPTVTVSGGGGSNAVAKATLAATTVASFTVTGGGASYTTPPVVSVSGGHSGGTDAAGTAVMAQTSIASYAIDGGQTNSGFTGVPTVTVGGSTSGGGSGAAATAVLTATTVASYAVSNNGAGYTDVPTVTVSGGGGTGAAATAVLASTGIASFTITNGGTGYDAVPTVVISDTGSGAGTASLGIVAITIGAGGSNCAANDATLDTSGTSCSSATIGAATVNAGAVQSIAITGAGSGCTSVPTITFGGSCSGASATVVLGVVSISVDTAGGYTTIPTVTFTVGANNGAGAAATAVLTGTTVSSVIINTGAGSNSGKGTGFTSRPSVSFSGGGSPSTTAVANAVLTATSLASVIVNTGGGTNNGKGSQYTALPDVAVSGMSGTVTVTAVMTPAAVASITRTNAGAGYTTQPTIAFSNTNGGGTSATATCVFAAAGIGTVIVDTAGSTNAGKGSGFTSRPTVAFSGGGSPSQAATATAVLTATSLASVIVNTGGGSHSGLGSGYLMASGLPTVSVSGMSGTVTVTAAWTPTTVASITRTNAGSAYTTQPTIAFSNTNGGAQSAAATCVFATTDVATVIVDTAGSTNAGKGSGFTSRPTVAFSGGGSPSQAATATAVLTATSLASVIVNTGGGTNNGKGSQYTALPDVAVSGMSGTVTVTAVMTPTTVASITRTNAGAGYTTQPTIAFSNTNGGGTSATAACVFAAAGIGTVVRDTGSGTNQGKGSGYTLDPTITFNVGTHQSGTPTAATAKAVFTATDVDSATQVNKGNGYTCVPDVAFSGCSGSGAAATAVLKPTSVASITRTSAGTGYTTMPTTAFSTDAGCGGASCTAKATVVFAAANIGSLVVGSQGSGYTHDPNINFDITITNAHGSAQNCAGSGATGKAVFNPTPVQSVAIDHGGTGFDDTVTFTITNCVGTGAAAVAVATTDWFVYGDIETNSCDGSSITGSGTQYTLVCSASDGNDIWVQVPKDKFKDRSGQFNVASERFVITSDRTGPTVTITASDSNGVLATTGYSRADTITWTFTLNEPASNVLHSATVAGATTDLFAVADVTTKTNCVNPLFTGGNLMYTLRCDANPAGAGSSQDITVGVAVGSGTNGFKDAAGNYNQASSPTTFVVKSDNVAPTVTITTSDGTNAITTGRTDLSSSITFTFTLNEAPSGNAFEFSDVNKQNCNGGSLGGSGQAFTLVCAASDGNDIWVEVAADKYTDAAGNGNVASERFVITSDRTGPTVTITASDSNGVLATTGTSRDTAITWTFTLNEPASNVLHSATVAGATTDLFAVADVTTKTNCVNPLFTGGNLMYTLRCDANDGKAITVGVAVGSSTDGFKDAAGNYNQASSPTTFVVNSDTTVPTVTISASDGWSTTGVGSVTVTNAGTGYTSVPTVAFSGGSGSNAAATASLGIVSITIGAGGSSCAASDATLVIGSTNCNGASIGLATINSGAVQSIAISSAGSGCTSVPTITFGGSCSGASATVVLGVVSIAITTAGTGYTSAPTVAFSGGGGSSAAGTAVPTPLLNGASSIASGSTAITFSFSLSEAATNFAVGDIIMTNCDSKSALSGSGQAYALTCAAKDGFDITAEVRAAQFTDAASNSNVKQVCDAAGSACDVFTISSDTTVPFATISASDSAGTALSSGGAAASAVTYTFQLSEPSANFEKSDVTENCVGDSFSGAKQTYFLRCPYQDGVTASVSLSQNVFSDTAGKLNTAASAFTVVFT